MKKLINEKSKYAIKFLSRVTDNPTKFRATLNVPVSRYRRKATL